MQKKYRLNEVSKILNVNVGELKKIIKKETELSSAKLNLVEMNKISEKDLEILKSILKKREIKKEGKKTILKEKTIKIESMFSTDELENFKHDLMRAIYSGDKKSEKLLLNLKKHISSTKNELNETQELILTNNLTKTKGEFRELKAKLDRQEWAIDRMEMSIRKIENSIKRLENIQSSKLKVISVENETKKEMPPLSWYEKLFYQFFTPWKLRGRV